MKTLKTLKHLRGWIPDFPDHRDFLYAAVRPGGVRLPKSVDLRAGMSPVENQGQLGSCTANALAGALEFLEIKSGKLLVDLSRLFIYYNERAIEHTEDQDSGAMIRDGIKTLASLGVPDVVATRWQIDSAAAVPMMDAFYGGLAQGFTVPRALTAARQSLMRDARYHHPYYWAAYYASGSGTSDLSRIFHAAR